MKIDVIRRLPEHIDTFVLIQEEDGQIQGLEYIEDDLAHSIEAFAQVEDFHFSYGSVKGFCRMLGKHRQNIIICGAGDKDELNTNKFRKLFADCWRTALKMKSKQLYVLIGFEYPINDVHLGHVMAESAMLVSYRFNKYLSDDKLHELESLHLILNTKNTRHINRGILEGRIFAETTNLARNLVNEPANVINPETLADAARKAALQYGFSIEVHSMDKIKRLKMDAFLAVGKGSKNEPRLIIMRYMGNPDRKHNTIGLIGKGLTFDTGGYCLKTAQGMFNMKNDMGGAAAVIGAMAAITTMKLKVNVVAIVAAAENMISGDSYRPGDIITSMAGKTIEVVNTDAEGRLTLVDAVHYALEKEKVDRVLDIATLTGAAVAALGHDFSAVLGNNAEWLDQIKDAADFSGEAVWQMPLHAPYKELIKSEIADLKNSGGPMAGCITAALFIKEFVQDKPWIHLDIAGTALKDKETGISSFGATGVGVRLITSLLRNME
ncbi:MAG TPA: leucyl aminopeptidase [Candidatus Cloacimonadota bacterium]|nr:leucyl aminopeptidase [Candidatus Cloacimonadota bacterium]